MPTIRRAVTEDAREFNSLINQLGGPNVFRSQFGQYNFTSLIEYSHLALSAITEDGSCGCFAVFSDGILSVGDNISFDDILFNLNDLLPCRVSFLSVACSFCCLFFSLPPFSLLFSHLLNLS